MAKRDSQRQRVYDAQYTGQWTEDSTRTMRLDQCQQFVDSVTKSVWWKHRCTVRYVEVKAGARNGHAWAGYSYILTAPDSRTKRTMIHELAHILTDAHGNDYAPHGAEYCANYVALARHFLSKAEGDALLVSFRKARVKVRGAKKAAYTSPKVRCSQCHKQVYKSTAWTVRGWSLQFCTRRCGNQWFAARLVKS